ESCGADRPAQTVYAIKFAGTVRRHHGGRLPDSESEPAAGWARAVRRLGAGKTSIYLVLRLLGGDLPWRASIVVLRWWIWAHGVRRTGLCAEPPERRPVLSMHRCAQPVEAGRDRALVDAGNQKGRDALTPAQARQGLSRTQHQRLQTARR